MGHVKAGQPMTCATCGGQINTGDRIDCHHVDTHATCPPPPFRRGTTQYAVEYDTGSSTFIGQRCATREEAEEKAANARQLEGEEFAGVLTGRVVSRFIGEWGAAS